MEVEDVGNEKEKVDLVPMLVVAVEPAPAQAEPVEDVVAETTGAEPNLAVALEVAKAEPEPELTATADEELVTCAEAAVAKRARVMMSDFMVDSFKFVRLLPGLVQFR